MKRIWIFQLNEEERLINTFLFRFIQRNVDMVVTSAARIPPDSRPQKRRRTSLLIVIISSIVEIKILMRLPKLVNILCCIVHFIIYSNSINDSIIFMNRKKDMLARNSYIKPCTFQKCIIHNMPYFKFDTIFRPHIK